MKECQDASLIRRAEFRERGSKKFRSPDVKPLFFAHLPMAIDHLSDLDDSPVVCGECLL